MKYKISIILPVYNGESSLMLSVNSVINQTLGFSNIELIIIDDKSNDNSKSLISALSNQYDNVNPIYLDINSGYPGKPRNIGVKNASSEYIMFIDCGDTYSKNICKTFYNVIKQNDVDLVSCGLRGYFNGTVQNSIDILGGANDLIFNPIDYENYFKDVSMFTKIFKRDIIKKNNIHCLENSLVEDSYFVMDYLFNISKAIYLNDFYGYNYIIPEPKYDLNSMSRTVNKEKILSYITGFYKIIDLINEKGNENLLKMISNGYMLVLITYFAKFKSSYEDEVEIVDKIYNLEKYIDYKVTLNQKWASFINHAILNKRYKFAILFARLMFILQSSSFFKKIYRKRIGKKNIY